MEILQVIYATWNVNFGTTEDMETLLNSQSKAVNKSRWTETSNNAAAANDLYQREPEKKQLWRCARALTGDLLLNIQRHGIPKVLRSM